MLSMYINITWLDISFLVEYAGDHLHIKILCLSLQDPLFFETLGACKTVSFCAILMKLSAFFIAHRAVQNAPNFIKIWPKLTVLANSKSANWEGPLTTLLGTDTATLHRVRITNFWAGLGPTPIIGSWYPLHCRGPLWEKPPKCRALKKIGAPESCDLRDPLNLPILKMLK